MSHPQGSFLENVGSTPKASLKPNGVVGHKEKVPVASQVSASQPKADEAGVEGIIEPVARKVEALRRAMTALMDDTSQDDNPHRSV